jgi:hypothetical protein
MRMESIIKHTRSQEEPARLTDTNWPIELENHRINGTGSVELEPAIDQQDRRLPLHEATEFRPGKGRTHPTPAREDGSRHALDNGELTEVQGRQCG